jgi:hypothetical protein
MALPTAAAEDASVARVMIVKRMMLALYSVAIYYLVEVVSDIR